MHHGETAHRARAEGQQGQAGNQRGDVGIQNGGPSAVVTGVYGGLRRRAIAQFFAYTLVDQHVGINRHAQHQGHRRHARQRERRLQHGQHGHQQQQIDRQRNAGYHAEQQVVHAHEHCDGQKAPGHAVKPFGDVFCTQ